MPAVEGAKAFDGAMTARVRVPAGPAGERALDVRPCNVRLVPEQQETSRRR